MDREAAIRKAVEELSGGEPDFGPDDVTVKLVEGTEWHSRPDNDWHSGPGWYAWYAEYPEEGSIFLGGA